MTLADEARVRELEDAFEADMQGRYDALHADPGGPVEPCPACEDGLIHPDNEAATEWTCDHCGYHQTDEVTE